MATRTGFSSPRLQQLASLLTFVSLAALAGCGAKVVDLGANEGSGPVYSKSIPVALPDAGAATHDPVRIVDREPNGCGNGTIMGMYTLNAGNLYWLVPNNGTSYSLRTCAVDHCADSVRELTTGTAGGSYCTRDYLKTSMQIDGDQIYWLNPDLSTPTPDPPVLFATKRVPSNSSGVSFPLVQWAPVYVVSEGVLYATTSEGTLIQCQASDCEHTQVRYDLVPPDDQGMNPLMLIGLDDNYLYLSRGNSGAYSTAPMRLLRVAKDPHAPLEILLSTWPTAAGDFTVHGDIIYWVEHVSMGQLLSCPKMGCADRNPTLIVSGLENPTGLAADDEYLYILEPPQYQEYSTTFTIARPGRILKCPLSGCAEPTVLYTGTTERWIEQLRVDERFVYFSGTDCTPDSKWSSECGFITAIPK